MKERRSQMPDIDIILARFDELKELVKTIQKPQSEVAAEIIDSDELIKRLQLSRATLVTYRKNRTIPFIKIGSSIRYNYPKVILALEKRNGKK
jgi:hypothetical protein